MKDKFRIGIVGCGGIAREHVRAYQAIAGVEIAQVFDVVDVAARLLAKAAGARVAGLVEEMAASASVDAVSICTPPAMHPQNAAPFLAAGIAVLCEKPLAATLDAAGALAEQVRRSDSPFMVAFCHRFH